MCLAMWLYSKMYGKLVGKDSLGNKYYESRLCLKAKSKDKKRWVMLSNKELDTSFVPAVWHSWLHYQSDHVLKYAKGHKIVKHKPNMTGTSEAQVPSGFVKHRPSILGEHKVWRPK